MHYYRLRRFGNSRLIICGSCRVGRFIAGIASRNYRRSVHGSAVGRFLNERLIARSLRRPCGRNVCLLSWIINRNRLDRGRIRAGRSIDRIGDHASRIGELLTRIGDLVPPPLGVVAVACEIAAGGGRFFEQRHRGVRFRGLFAVLFCLGDDQFDRLTHPLDIGHGLKRKVTVRDHQPKRPVTLNLRPGAFDHLAGNGVVNIGGAGPIGLLGIECLGQKILCPFVIALFEIAVHQQNVRDGLNRRVARLAADVLELVNGSVIVADGNESLGL